MDKAEEMEGMVFQSSEARWKLGWRRENEKSISDRTLAEDKHVGRFSNSLFIFSLNCLYFLCHLSGTNSHSVLRNDKHMFNVHEFRAGTRDYCA